MQQRSKLIFAVAAMTLSCLAGAQTTARSVVSDAQSGAVYAGYDASSTPASSVTVVKQVAGADAWTAPVAGANAVYAMALSPDRRSLYAVGAEATRAGFLVRLDPENGSVMSRFELMAAPQTVTVGADGAVYAGGQGFVLKLNAELQQVLFAADPGGTVVGLAVDPADGSVYTALAVGNEAFAAKLSADGARWLYRTSLGHATPAAIVLERRSIYVTGTTDSTDLPLKSATQGWLNGASDAFLARIDAGDGAIVWSTYLGGGGADAAWAIASSEDASRLMLAGWTTSSDFPGAGMNPSGNSGDAFVANVDAATGNVLDSTYLGIAKDDRIQAISVQGNQVILTGPRSKTELTYQNSLVKAPSAAIAPNAATAQATTGCLSNPGVASLGDSLTAGTLRYAVTNACDGSTIQISATGTITLASRILLNKNLSIMGPGAASLTISGGGTTRIFFVGTGTLAPFTSTVNLSGMTLANGYGKGGDTNYGGGGAGMGGAIFQNGGTLNLSNMVFSGNRAIGGHDGLGSASQTGGGGFGGDAPTNQDGASGGDLGGAGGTLQIAAGPGGGGISVYSGGFGGGGGNQGYGGWGGGAGPGSLTGGLLGNGFGGCYGAGAGFGGAIFAYAGSLDLSSVSFNNNQAVAGNSMADGRGGALFVYSVAGGATAKGANMAFSGNVAANAGMNTQCSADYYGRPAGQQFQCPGLDNIDVCGVVSGAPATLTANSSSTQSATINTDFATALSVIVKDLGANPVPGVTVTFTAPASGASGKFENNSTTITVVTNASGIAAAPFMANSTAGTYRVTVATEGPSAQAFTLTNLAGPPAQITANTGATPQTANAGALFANPLAVTVTDVGHNPVPGANVIFTAPGSLASGKFSNNTTTITVATNASGVASTTITANLIVGGPYPVIISAGNVTTNLSLTNKLGVAASMTANAGTTPQLTLTNDPFDNGLGVTLKDAGNNPVSGVTVTFKAPASGASGAFSNNTATISVATNALGVALVPFTANATPSPAPYQVTAAAAGLTSVIFTLTNAGPPALMTVNPGSTPQSATIDTTFHNPLAVTVTDALNNPIPNMVVTFTAPIGGASGTFTGRTVIAVVATEDSGVTVATNGSGVASVTFHANPEPGSYTVSATAAGLPKRTFSLTNLGPASIKATLGTTQSAPLHSAFPSLLEATVLDANGNPVSGVDVMFALSPVQPQSGAFSNGQGAIYALTDGAGIAQAAITANGVAGTYIVQATLAAYPKIPALQFTLTNGGPPAHIYFVSVASMNQSAKLLAQFAIPLAVTVTDATGEPISGVTVVFTAPRVNATGTFSNGLTSISVTTNSSGVASATVTADSEAGGTYNVSATVQAVPGLERVFTLTDLE